MTGYRYEKNFFAAILFALTWAAGKYLLDYDTASEWAKLVLVGAVVQLGFALFYLILDRDEQ